MSESGLPRFPGQQVPGQPPASSERGQRSVEIKTLPDTIIQLKTARIEARVEQIARDATVVLQTQEGRVEVQVRDPRVLAQLREGQIVQLDIPPPPAGQDIPRHAEIVILPPSKQPQPLVRASGTPIDVIIQGPEVLGGANVPNTVTPQIIEAGVPPPTYPIRLEPLNAEQVLAYLPEPVEIIARLVVDSLQQAVSAVNIPLPNVLAVINLPALSLPVPVAPQVTNISSGVFVHDAVTVNIQTPVATNETPPSVLTQLPTVPIIAVSENAAAITVPKSEVVSPPVLTIASVLPTQTEGVFVSSFQAPLVPAQPFSAEQAVLKEQITQNAPVVQGAPAVGVENIILSGQKAGQQSAVVVAQTAEQLPVILSFNIAGEPEGFFLLHAPFETVAPGTQINFVPNHSGQTNVLNQVNLATLPLLPASVFSFLAAEPWPVLNQIQSALAQVAPQAAQAFSNVIPSPSNPAQIVPAALFFIAAVRGGDIQSWLGQRSVDALSRAGQSGLLARLGQESGMVARSSAEPLVQDWRALSLPFAWDNEINKVNLYYKQDREADGDEDSGSEKQTRFVFDLNMNAMGPVQIDGLFRPGRLDVIVRTAENFAQDMQAEMRRVYSDALKETEVTGELSFQTDERSWVKITPDDKSEGVKV